jgi:hypothetical protein
MAPVNNKLAGIKGLLVMSLPALLLPHRPGESDLVVLLTRHESSARDLRPIDQMARGEQGLVRQRVMNRVHRCDILVRC